MEGVLHVCPSQSPSVVAELASFYFLVGYTLSRHQFDVFGSFETKVGSPTIKDQSHLLPSLFPHTQKGAIPSHRQVPNRTRCLDLNSSMKPTYFTCSRSKVGSLFRPNLGSNRFCVASTGSRNCRICFLLPRQSFIHDVSSADPLGLRALFLRTLQ